MSTLIKGLHHYLCFLMAVQLIEPEIIMAYSLGKRRGTTLLKKDYHLFVNFIIACFESRSEITFADLVNRAYVHDFSYPKDKALWILIKVKQDMEFRGILKNKFVGRSQSLRINKKVLGSQLTT